MTLPFTRDQFLDVFAAYHRGWGDGAMLLWVLAFFVVGAWVRGRASTRALTAFLAVLWLWSAVVYHALLFSAINPAARLFALLFAVQAALFVRAGLVRGELRFEPGGHGTFAPALAIAALAYPLVSMLMSGDPLRSPSFGVPCPTTLFSAGLLLGARPEAPRHLFVIPIFWSLIGGSAAISLGIAPDALLLVAAAAMIVRVAAPHARGPFGSTAHPAGHRP